MNRDFEIFELIKKEQLRQIKNVELIASENYVSEDVLEAMGSILTNKYAEGYPDKRYYGGCECVDKIEKLAIERVTQLFNCKYANVQPHSGSQANMAAYMAIANYGDTILAMDLSQGGHLTHGSPVNFSGKLYNMISYGVDDLGYIDYQAVKAIAKKNKPKVIVAGASAYSRVIDFKKFREIADEVGAYLMVDMAHIAGLVATGHHLSPFPYADIVTSTTHKTLRGPRGGIILTNNEDLINKVNKAIFPGIQGGPLENVIAAKAVCFKEAMSNEFKEYISNVVNNSRSLADYLLDKGFKLVSGGTDNHLILIDLTNRNITGKKAQELLDRVGISTNKNTIPNEKLSPFVTSGIRIGTAAVTSRGFNTEDMRILANIMDLVLIDDEIEDNLNFIAKQVKSYFGSRPIPNKIRLYDK